MDIQIELLKLYREAIENSRPFDDGLGKPYSSMTITRNGWHLSCSKLPIGSIDATLNTPDYSMGGFSLYPGKTGKLAGYITVEGEIRFIEEDPDLQIMDDFSLEQIAKTNPDAVKLAIQGFALEISELSKDVERTEVSKAHFVQKEKDRLRACSRRTNLMRLSQRTDHNKRNNIR